MTGSEAFPMPELQEYSLQPVHGGSDFCLYRGKERGSQVPILALAVDDQLRSVQGIRRLEHEFSLAAELDPTWAAQPLALMREEGRAVLLLKDPGGELLETQLRRERPAD